MLLMALQATNAKMMSLREAIFNPNHIIGLLGIVGQGCNSLAGTLQLKVLMNLSIYHVEDNDNVVDAGIGVGLDGDMDDADYLLNGGLRLPCWSLLGGLSCF